MPQVIIQVQNGGSPQPLQKAWVYWRAGGSATLLRSNNDGRLLSLSGGDRNQPWQYTQPFTTAANVQVDVYYSRGALPIPDARLNEHNDVFYRRTVVVTPPNPLPPANVGPNTPNTLAGIGTATIILPNILITLTTPREMRLWPIRWELPADCDLDATCRTHDPAARIPDYQTAGLDQGSTLHWPGSAPTLPVAENSQAPALPDEVVFHGNHVWIRPRERVLHFEGTIDARATGISVQMFDRSGNVAQLRPTIDPRTAAVDHVAGTVDAAAGTTRPYKADVFFFDAVNTFGIVQFFVLSTGMTPPIIEAFTGYLCGFQITLVDDFAANADGTHPGPLLNEANEMLSVDFVNSPNTDRTHMRAQTRLRRMCFFPLNGRDRPLDTTAAVSAQNPSVFRPEMPMWMAEFQAVGVSATPLTTVMALRAFFEGSPFDLTLGLTWQLTLTWDGPDHMTDPHQAYQYDISLPQPAQTVHMHFGRNGQFVDAHGANVVVNAGELPNAFDTPPTQAAFPVTGRRLPKMLVSGQQRPWGRKTGAVTKDAWVCECQLRLIQTRNGNDVELIRGGDGSLKADLTVDGANVVQAPETGPAMRLPRFRIRGFNPTPQQADAVRDAVVDQFVNLHGSDAWVAMLPARAWRETARLIFAHEAGGQQFDLRHSQILFLGRGINLYYGNENGMPFFGGPHGYGFVQVDYGPNPIGAGAEHVATADQLHDELWNYVDCIRGGVRHLINVKGRSAFNHLHGHILADARRMRAVFQREVVRRYNGGSEFVFHGGDWMIHPSIIWTNPHHHSEGVHGGMLYPNSVLGTAVTYFTGDNHANRIITVTPATQSAADQAAADTQVDQRTQFNWPVQFNTADYGPGI